MKLIAVAATAALLVTGLPAIAQTTLPVTNPKAIAAVAKSDAKRQAAAAKREAAAQRAAAKRAAKEAKRAAKAGRG